MKKFCLITILFIGLFLRIYKLDTRPLGFTWDEAAIGYNAYSLLLTGKDEHGVTMPIIFKSFGDFKPGLYIYTAVLPIKLLGLNEFSTRLPSAIFGTISILLTYILVALLSKSSKMAICCILMMAINPWSLHFSRGAWEVNMLTCLLLLGSTLFVFFYSSKKTAYLYLSAIIFGLTFWTYQGAKLLTPLILFSLLIVFKSKIFSKSILIFGTLILILLTPVIINFKQESGRLKVFNVFSYSRSEDYVQKILAADGATKLSLKYLLFHSEIYDQLRGVLQRYLNHYSPRFLFFEGDWSSGRHSIAYYGYFHLPEIISILVGIWYLSRYNSKFTKILFLWTIFSAIPAALSRDIVTGVRSLPLSVPLIIFSGIGLSRITKKTILYPTYLSLFFFFALFIDMYFTHSPILNGPDWLSTYPEALRVVKDNEDKYENVVISSKLGQPYIFTLFYLKYPPSTYQKFHAFIPSENGDVGTVLGFSKYEFRDIYWPADRSKKSTLFVGNEFELPTNDLENTADITEMGVIYYPDGRQGFKIVATK